MRVGLVGAGRIGAMHARLLASLDGVEELYITDIVHRALGSRGGGGRRTGAPRRLRC